MLYLRWPGRWGSSGVTPVTATIPPPRSPPLHYPLLLHPVLFLCDLTECIISHLFACLFPVFLLRGRACRQHRDRSRVISRCGLLLRTGASTRYPLDKRLRARWTNDLCGGFLYARVNNDQNKFDEMKGGGKDFAQKTMLIPPLFLKNLALRLVSEDGQGYLPARLDSRVLLQGADESTREREGCPRGSLFALDTGPTLLPSSRELGLLSAVVCTEGADLSRKRKFLHHSSPNSLGCPPLRTL